MKHRTLLFFSLLLTLIAPPLALAKHTDPPSRAGRVSLVEGAAMFYDEQSGWRDASVNYPVTSQNSLATRGRSRAEMRVGSTALRIADDSQLDLLGITDNLIDARLTQGSLNLRVRTLNAGDIVRIATTQSQTTIRAPGRYRIDADNQATRVTVLQGAASVATGGAPEVALYAGTSTVVGFDNNYNRPLETAQSDAFDDWSRERDYRFERARSAQYVSPEMTGYEELDNHGAWRSDPSYGNVWVPSYVASGWAPYQDGRWVNVQPWGWTWVDNAPWGFAPFHYGRWVQVNGFWAWSPGRYHARPVYAPALVAFVGEPGWNVSFTFGSAPAVGWFPLGWGEPYRPHYYCSSQYGRNINITHVHNYTHNDHPHDQPSIHRGYIKIVPQDKFTSPVGLMNQVVKSVITPPVTRNLPVAPPSSPRPIMTNAPGLIQNQNVVVGRIGGSQAPAPQAQVITAPAQPMRTDNPWRRQPIISNAQPDTTQVNPAPQPPRSKPVMQQPIPIAQPGVIQGAAQPAMPHPLEQNNRGHHQQPGPNVISPQPGVIQHAEPVRPPAYIKQAVPQNLAQPALAPAAPMAVIKNEVENHRRQREDSDNNAGERKMMIR